MSKNEQSELSSYTLPVIGVMHSPYGQKFAVPRQSGLVPDALSTIEFFAPYGDPQAFAGLQGFSHLHVIFMFHQIPEGPFRAQVRPPRLGGNQHVGVFATRSPFRPSRLGLSVVKLENLTVQHGLVCLQVSGADLVDGTPIIDVKPYIPFVDALPEAQGGFAAAPPELKQVIFSAKAQEQPETGRNDTFSIYQLKDGDETRDYRFEPYDRLQAAGLAVDRANYELVYTAPLVPGTSLDDIFTRFNIDHPKDFKGHSLSVSDVVVLHQDGQDTAHYVDRGDFKQIPEFLQEKQPQRENPLKAAEQTTEQNYNMIDGRINNTPTVDELEAKVKAGETISLVDLANAVKADKERGKAAKPEKKPSIRAQLKADKERAAQKKPAKQKSQGLERS